MSAGAGWQDYAAPAANGDWQDYRPTLKTQVGAPKGGNGSPPSMPLAPTLWGQMKQAYEGTLPILDYTRANQAALGSIARGVVGGIKGGYNTLKEAANAWNDPHADVGDTILPDPHIEQVPGAIRDINRGPDPGGTYWKVAGETAGQGAGAALDALAMEGAGRAFPEVGNTLRARIKARAPLPPELTTPSRTLPGMNPPEVVRPPMQTAQPIPQRSGLALPPGPEAASPSLVEQMRASAPETQEQMLSRWAARNAATGRSPAPQEPIAPETMTPQEKDIWQQSIFGQEPEKYDPGQISRQQNPEPTRAETKGPSLLDQIREQVRQIQAQPAEDVPAAPYGRQLRIEGQDVDPNIDLRSAVAESTRRIRAARGLPPLQD